MKNDYDYENKEFNGLLYRYINCYGVKIHAQTEAYAIRTQSEGKRYARVVKMAGNRWGVYATNEWGA